MGVLCTDQLPASSLFLHFPHPYLNSDFFEVIPCHEDKVYASVCMCMTVGLLRVQVVRSQEGGNNTKCRITFMLPKAVLVL